MTDGPREPDLEAIFVRMERDLPRVTPDPGLLERIEQRVRADQLAAARRRRTRIAAVLVAAAASAATAALLVALPGREEPALVAAIQPHRSSGVQGEVRVFAPTSPRARIEIELRGLPRAPAGHHYTVWVLRAGSKEMTPIASFAVAGELELPLPGPGRYAAIDISLQRDAAPPVHSGISLAGAELLR